ncbi:hypothetical protein ACFFRR_001124 [Megaselia abdita]
MNSYFVVLEKEIIRNHSDDSRESDVEFHNRETDFCKDSSDSSFDETSFDFVEYEVASTTDIESQFDVSSSGTDEHFGQIDITTLICGTTPTEFADTSDSDSHSHDSELSPADFWKCIKCNNQQNNPLFRYCEKCYQIKKTHFPPPPRMRKRRYHKSVGNTRRRGPTSTTTSSSLLINGNNGSHLNFKHNLHLRKSNSVNHIKTQDSFHAEDENLKSIRKRKTSSLTNNSKRIRTNSFSECSEVDSTNSQQVIGRHGEEKECDVVSLADTVIGELSEEEINLLKGDIEINKLLEVPKKASKRDPNVLFQSFSCIETTVDDSPNQLPIIKRKSTLSNDSSSSSSGSCIFCLTEPKNAVFVHSKFVHLCSCYKCAVKIFNKNKRCPICNCSVKTVLQVFAH